MPFESQQPHETDRIDDTRNAVDPSEPGTAADAEAEAGVAGTAVEPLLTPVEARVVGSLVEKSTTTPEYYPLSLNALVNACNQKSNRDPVVELDEKAVARALESLRDKKLARVVQGGDQRVPKHRHVLDEGLDMTAAQLAVVAELLLRGPQTVGELRGRASRMHPFDELADAQVVLDELAARSPAAVVRLPRQPGRKEHRWAQLLTGPPTGAAAEDDEAAGPSPEPATLEVRAENERLTRLEETVAALQAEVAQLRAELEGFRQQFE